MRILFAMYGPIQYTSPFLSDMGKGNPRPQSAQECTHSGGGKYTKKSSGKCIILQLPGGCFAWSDMHYIACTLPVLPSMLCEMLMLSYGPCAYVLESAMCVFLNP